MRGHCQGLAINSQQGLGQRSLSLWALAPRYPWDWSGVLTANCLMLGLTCWLLLWTLLPHVSVGTRLIKITKGSLSPHGPFTDTVAAVYGTSNTNLLFSSSDLSLTHDLSLSVSVFVISQHFPVHAGTAPVALPAAAAPPRRPHSLPSWLPWNWPPRPPPPQQQQQQQHEKVHERHLRPSHLNSKGVTGEGRGYGQMKQHDSSQQGSRGRGRGRGESMSLTPDFSVAHIGADGFSGTSKVTLLQWE